MNLSIKGKITKMLPIQSGEGKTGKTWQSQSFVIDTGAEYNPEICFSMFGQTKIDMLRLYEVGASVDVYFNVSSREFNGKYYHNLDAWKIDASGDQSGHQAAPVGDSDVPF